jgi:ubiquitin carboxyl-terminal hydrolase 48
MLTTDLLLGQSSSRLEDRIAALLQPETLSGDNQSVSLPLALIMFKSCAFRYFCSRCNSLQDATRYTELRQLPPVLHFSLLRFIYDFNSMERKKSKHAVSFPTSLDMRYFLGTAAARKVAATDEAEGVGHIYELRGVLLHKGPSAYHGHYEAQVFDVKCVYLYSGELYPLNEHGKAIRPGFSSTTRP